MTCPRGTRRDQARNAGREQVWLLGRLTRGQAADSPGHAWTGRSQHSSPVSTEAAPELAASSGELPSFSEHGAQGAWVCSVCALHTGCLGAPASFCACFPTCTPCAAHHEGASHWAGERGPGPGQRERVGSEREDACWVPGLFKLSTASSPADIPLTHTHSCLASPLPLHSPPHPQDEAQHSLAGATSPDLSLSCSLASRAYGSVTQFPRARGPFGATGSSAR